MLKWFTKEVEDSRIKKSVFGLTNASQPKVNKLTNNFFLNFVRTHMYNNKHNKKNPKNSLHQT